VAQNVQFATALALSSLPLSHEKQAAIANALTQLKAFDNPMDSLDTWVGLLNIQVRQKALLGLPEDVVIQIKANQDHIDAVFIQHEQQVAIHLVAIKGAV